MKAMAKPPPVTEHQGLYRVSDDAEWTCGHRGGAVCAECYRILAHRANELAEELETLREELDNARRQFGC